jgi:hypothetical protein
MKNAIQSIRRNSGGVFAGMASGILAEGGVASGVLVLAVAAFVLSMLIVNQLPFRGVKEGTLDLEYPLFVHPKVSRRLAVGWKLVARYGA